ncbi:Early-responsive to dehydration stress protein [Actinidia rufa]|uniref:Early-responsive to dehydration stress protein n=1 Tax=Actinidia rufa TaxID=165716 RepID=A0A7J0EXN1_9ERIC|nr:Early-responsive to dehydration stress protein [Actinidia rufa]
MKQPSRGCSGRSVARRRSYVASRWLDVAEVVARCCRTSRHRCDVDATEMVKGVERQKLSLKGFIGGSFKGMAMGRGLDIGDLGDRGKEPVDRGVVQRDDALAGREAAGIVYADVGGLLLKDGEEREDEHGKPYVDGRRSEQALRIHGHTEVW